MRVPLRTHKRERQEPGGATNATTSHDCTTNLVAPAVPDLAYRQTMLLEGSCHCAAVRFTCDSKHPVPYQRCYCTICRKTGGGGGFIVNIEADANTLKVVGRENTAVYRATVVRDGEPTQSRHERHFCRLCGSHLWGFNARWPDLLHPVAGAIDTELPTPPQHVHMMVGQDSRAPWVAVEGGDADPRFGKYPSESLADWHRARGLDVE